MAWDIFFATVNSFVEPLINMVCEFKITSVSKFMMIRHFVKELLAKNSVKWPMKYIVDVNPQWNNHASPLSC